MNVEQLELEAKAKGAKQVANKLQRSDQLEKVDQLKRRASRQKASVEAMLKTALQSQLDGVKNGLNQLHQVLCDIKDIKSDLNEIDERLTEVPQLTEQLADVKDENNKHCQYAAAMENLKHIFTVPESVEKTRANISDGKYLHAHMTLSDLESSRDDLLFELHKHKSPTDIIMVKSYFSEVEKLSDMLAQKVWFILKRTLNTVCKEPTLIVTAMRIIEREERIDQLAMQQEKETGFLPPGRPKNWRQKAFLTIEETIKERFEGSQLEERDSNSSWLIRHLEVIRLLILDDLRVVKSVCVPCFPPHYDIVNKYVQMYHNCLSLHLLNIIACGLDGKEYVTMLMWLNTYESSDLLLHPDLNIDVKAVGPLLDNATVESLQNKYVKDMENNFNVWMKKTIESEVQDWRRDIEPETDGDDCFHTSLPIVVFQMVDQNLQVAKTIGPNLVLKMVQFSMLNITKLGQLYYDAIIEFKQRYFDDRSQMKHFTHYMVAMVNNCLHFVELSHQLKDQYLKPGVHDKETIRNFETMIRTYQGLRKQTMDFLLEEMFLDLGSHFQDLLSKKWLSSSIAMDTICVTLEDYHQDYNHLRPKNYDEVLALVQHRIYKQYIIAVLMKKITFSTFEERQGSADKIIKEVEQFQNLVKNLAPQMAKADSPYDILIRFAEILKVKDKEVLPLILSGIVQKYPDLSQHHLSALLSLREDINRLELRQLVNEVIPENKETQPTGSVPKSILSSIQLPGSLIDELFNRK